MDRTLERTPRIAVVGCGGIGGVLCCHLELAGVPFFIVTTNVDVAAVWTTKGPTLNGKGIGPVGSDRILTKLSDSDAPFDLVFVAVQAPIIDDIAQDILGGLSDDGLVVVLSNGLCEERLAQVVEAQRIVGAVVAWGARMPQPGQYLRTSSGGFLVGALEPQESMDLSSVERCLSTVGPVHFTANLRGARFSKLTINCAITALGTIGGKSLGALLLHRGARNLALRLMEEAVEVARAEGVTLENVTRLDLAALSRHASSRRRAVRFGMHALLLVAGARYRRLRSSMLAAMERGKAPAIDHINGEIVKRGERLGIFTPVNRAATEVVWEIYEKRRAAGYEALREVARRSSAAPAPR